MGSGLPRHVSDGAHDWRQVLTFQGKSVPDPLFTSFTNAFLLHKQPGITNAPRPFMMSWQRSDDTSGKFLFFHITHSS
jgi:hypothetical protein